MRIGEFVIICDTREQRPWKFIHPCIRRKLDAGDYSLQGWEKHIRIERKGSTSEFARNCGADWLRFKDALHKLARYKHKAIVCDFNLADIYKGDWRGNLSVEAVLAKVSEITLEMSIPIIFAGKRGRKVTACMLLKYFNRNRR